MFLRLLIESFRRQRRRKALAGVAILLGTTAVTAMLALATTIGDRIHRELAVYGANIVVTPKADSLDVKVGGIDLKPATGGTYLHAKDLEKLHGIFWSNNITGVSPELSRRFYVASFQSGADKPYETTFVGMWFSEPFGTITTGAPQLHPSWHLHGSWPVKQLGGTYNGYSEAVVGAALAKRMNLHLNDYFYFGYADVQQTGNHGTRLAVTGILNAGDETDQDVLIPLADAQSLFPNGGLRMIGQVTASSGGGQPAVTMPPDAVSRLEVSATTRPEDALARMDPDKMSPKTRDLWYCRAYANSIAYQIQEAIPGSRAEQVRRVEQSEGTVLERISGLMWLISAAALLAAGFAVSAAMATAVMERRGEIGLMRSLGASKAAIASLFYAESGLLAMLTGTVGFFAGSALAWWLGRSIFPADGAVPLLNLVLLPVIVALALTVAIAGSTPSIRAALNADPTATLRGDA